MTFPEPDQSWATSPESDQVIKAWVTALGSLEDIAVDAAVTAGPMRYKYATLAKVLGEVRPVLAKHGLVLSQFVSDDGVSTVVYHESGQWMSFPPLHIEPIGKTPQHAGSAISYARRYSILAICGLATEDDDARTASGAGPEDRPTEPDPVAERVNAALTALKDLTPPDREKVKVWAEGRSLSPRTLYEDVDWLGEVEAYIDEGIGGGDLGDDGDDD